MQVSPEVKGWSDAEVDEALLYLDQASTSLELLVTAVAVYFFISGVYLGYSISHYFLPTKTDFGGR